ncbi:MAG: DUF58 domain-containing protein [Clostridia bacterium]|nr:DUF58 domain-containing protein [Clostridia bacterium]
MVFAAFLIALVAVYILQSFIYGERIFARLHYRAYFDREETEEGEEVFLYEEITNDGSLPIPNAKVSTRLEEGLKFIVTDKKDGSTLLTESVQSVFVLRGHAVIRRKWRIKCQKRGLYRPTGCVMVVNNIFGTGAASRTLKFSDIEDKRNTQLCVIPAIGEIPECGVENEFILGDRSVLLGMLEDPLDCNGIREYREGDPMNSFNWSATAAHDKLLVNRYEFTRERRYNVILNLRSRDNERDVHIPSIASVSEDSIKVCASLLDRAAANQPNVRLLVNTLADIEEGSRIAAESAYRTLDRDIDLKKKKFVHSSELNESEKVINTEKELLLTPPFVGKKDMADSLRLLAELPLYYTLTLEKTLELIADGEFPELMDGSFVIVTPYVNERILSFHNIMKARGVKVAFYISSTSQFDISERETEAETIYIQPSARVS